MPWVAEMGSTAYSLPALTDLRYCFCPGLADLHRSGHATSSSTVTWPPYNITAVGHLAIPTVGSVFLCSLRLAFRISTSVLRLYSTRLPGCLTQKCKALPRLWEQTLPALAL
jgi:hypothetical protein